VQSIVLVLHNKEYTYLLNYGTMHPWVKMPQRFKRADKFEITIKTKPRQNI